MTEEGVTVNVLQQRGPCQSLERRELIALATYLALATWSVGDLLADAVLSIIFPDPRQWLNEYRWAPEYVSSLIGILFGLILIAPTPRRYGLRIGAIGGAWKGVVSVWLLVVMVWWLVVFSFDLCLFRHSTAALWLLSPLAQDLVFIGYLYTKLDEAFPGFISPRLPVRRAVLVTSLFFGLYHAPNVLSSGVIWLALIPVTMLFFVCQGLMRQWTGSMLYATVAHSGVNFISWWYSR
jgi:membrane protease YdiL (CAAX protease family)